MSSKTIRYLHILRRGVSFFALISFVVTCCMLLFLNALMNTLDIAFTPENISVAAKVTLCNVVLLSLLFTVLDGIRRRIMVERPVRCITAAAERVMQGDFSTRIPPLSALEDHESFANIISYFNRMVEELSGIETLKTDFIANVSHELKTPLAIMQNYAELLRDPGLTAAQRAEYADAICGTARRLAGLISNILKLNKLENQTIFPKCKPYNLSEQLCSVLLSFESVWEAKRLEINTDIEPDIMVTADNELVEIVWQNLISNAVKFTPEGGSLSVSAHSDGSRTRVTVRDTGCGIAAETGKHIFERFYQGDTAHKSEGNGLGLALVKKIVDITGSDIAVSSVSGQGSTFTVTLPEA